MKKSPDVLVYDPYLTTLGGGEKVIFAVADFWRSRGARVTIGAPTLPKLAALEAFGYDTSLGVERVDHRTLGTSSARYDVLVYLTNTVPQPTGAAHSYLIVQFPFQHLETWRHPGMRYRQLQTLRAYRSVVYSRYVEQWLRRRWKQSALVLPPAVVQGAYRPERKRKTILSVGRFFSMDHSKRQDALIEAYKLLPSAVRDEWCLVLAGGVKDEHHDYVDSLRQAAHGYHIDFAVNVPQPRLVELYEQASLFWHGTGFGRASDTPENAEHFGMTTIEAMSYGCVPLAYADGGQVEIIDARFGMLWHSLPELAKGTAALIADEPRRQRQAQLAASEAARYDEAAFKRRCAEIFQVNGA